MHHCHHHCPSPSNTTSPAVIACIAGASVSRNKGNGETSSSSSSCDVWCTCCGYLRYLLVFLGLLACILDYMLRFNISVAIVAMVNNSVTQEVNSSYACPAAFNASKDAENTMGAGEYNWSAKEQGIILGAFFWGYVITKTIGGRIAEIFGPARTVTIAAGLCGVLTLLTPSVAAVHPLALAALRLLMGMLQGPIFPAIYSIISRWTLPGERATMTAVTFSGQGLGALVSLGLSGIVIQSFGWRWVFWGGGILALAWVPLWVVHVWDHPRLHPRISKGELKLLSINQNKPRRKVPWSRIVKSRHIYLFILLEFVTVWMQGIVLTEGPTFMTNQVGMDLQTVGLVNLVITAVAWVVCLFYGWLSDLIERREWLAVINIRRLSQGFGMVFVVSSAAGMAVTGCDTVLVTVYFILQGIGLPVGIVSYTMGPMDIAPNYAGTLVGMLGFGTSSGFLFPLFVSYFVDKKNGWLIIYVVSACMYGVASIIYMLGVSATEQEWNMYEEIPASDDVTTKRREQSK